MTPAATRAHRGGRGEAAGLETLRAKPMPGLSGKVTHSAPIADPAALLRSLAAAQALGNLELHVRTYESQRCIVSNALTGVLCESLAQPAADGRSRCALFVEGEIFNIGELGRSLPPGGDGSPAAILLRLFLAEGVEVAPRLNGNFNVVLYDEARGRLTIINDRFASKPLYYLEEPDGLLFASEKKGILALAASPPRVDSLGLLQVFAHRHNLGGRTFLEGIRCLRPGSRLTYEGGRLEVTRYHRFRFQVDRSSSNAELIEKGAELLRGAVTRRLAGKERILLSLSGGLDSRAVACAMPRDLRPVWARTRGFMDSPDHVCAAEIARRLGLQHYREDPASVPFSQILPKIVWRTESSVIFVNCMSVTSHALMKEKGDFLVGGHFGDVTAGAHIYPYMLVPRTRDSFLRRAYSWYTVHDREDLARVFTDEFLNEHAHRLQEAFFQSFDGIAGNHIQAYEIWDLEERQARMTVGAGPVDSHLFEAPYPFLDNAYIDFCLSLGTRVRFGEVLYQAMIHRLGPEVRHVPYANTGLRLRGSLLGNVWNHLVAQSSKAVTKTVRLGRSGFRRGQMRMSLEGITRNTREDPGFRQVLEDFVASSRFDRAIFDGGRILQTLREHLECRADHAHILSILATFAVGFEYLVWRRPTACPAEAGPWP